MAEKGVEEQVLAMERLRRKKYYSLQQQQKSLHPSKYKGYSDFIFTQLPKTGYIFFSIIQIFVFSVFPVFKLHVLSTGNIIYLENFFEKNFLFSTNNSTST